MYDCFFRSFLSATALGLVFLSSFGQGLAQPPFDGSPFGMHPAIVIPPWEYGIANPYDFAIDLGVSWDRSMMFIWTLDQPDPGRDEFLWRHDRQMRDVPDGISLLANIMIGEPRQDPKYFQYAQLGSFLPRDVPAFKKFVRAVVERYDGDKIDDMPGLRVPIRHWQVDNEPPHGLKDYARFLKITGEAIREADSEARILIGGVAGMPPVSSYIRAFDDFYLPILNELAKIGPGCFDIFDIHWYGNASGDYRGIREVYDHVSRKLESRDLLPREGFWVTEMGTYSGNPMPIHVLDDLDFPFQTEEQQAADLFRRCVYTLSLGFRKVFMAFGLKEGFKYDEGFFDFTGLIYDGKYAHDKGKGVKKQAYRTYRLLAEKLRESDWKNILTIQDGKNGIYSFEFKFCNPARTVYAAWWDCFNEPGHAKGGTRKWRLPFKAEAVRVTVAVANKSGDFASREVAANDEGHMDIIFGEYPVIIEKIR